VDKEQLILPIITWEAIADDDFVFRYGNYCLRVEQMDRKYWWWAVTKNDEEIAFDEPRATTELEAKLLSELAFIRQWIKNN